MRSIKCYQIDFGASVWHFYFWYDLLRCCASWFRQRNYNSTMYWLARLLWRCKIDLMAIIGKHKNRIYCNVLRFINTYNIFIWFSLVSDCIVAIPITNTNTHTWLGKLCRCSSTWFSCWKHKPKSNSTLTKSPVNEIRFGEIPLVDCIENLRGGVWRSARGCHICRPRNGSCWEW